MKALLITQSAPPHTGGVQKHIAHILPYFEKQGITTTVWSMRDELPRKSTLPIIGLMQIWLQLAKSWRVIQAADLIFIHDVFIYYLPFMLFFPKKKVITTLHGYEKIYPIPTKNKFYKQLAQLCSHATLSVGSYINSYYHLRKKNNYLTYGGVSLPRMKVELADKQPQSFLFVGRLEQDTGLPLFFEFLDLLQQQGQVFQVQFVGDGPLREQCQRYGVVLGWTNPRPYLRTHQVCFVGGYLSALEAMAFHVEVLAAYDNPLKRDYWLKSPFAAHIACGGSAQTLYQEYLRLHKSPNQLQQNYQLAKQYSWTQLAALYEKIYTS